jgi:hypothetical protein
MLNGWSYIYCIQYWFRCPCVNFDVSLTIQEYIMTKKQTIEILQLSANRMRFVSIFISFIALGFGIIAIVVDFTLVLVSIAALLVAITAYCESKAYDAWINTLTSGKGNR